MLAGRAPTTIGMTKNTAANTDRPAAVLRSRAPRAKPMMTTTVRYNDEPATVRSTPGSVSESTDPPREDSIAAAAKKSTSAHSRVTGSTRPTSTITLAHSTGSRDGTAASVARIIPVPYSPLNASTPTTPTTSWANNTPSRATDTPLAAVLPAETWYAVPDPATAAPRPTISTPAVSTHHRVVRSARGLVHSARTTRTWVTGPATVAGAGFAGAGASPGPMTAVIASLRRGTRCCPGSLA